MADNISSQILNGIKRIPTAIVGGPVDVTNLIMGFASGKGTDGFVDTPVGGSKQLNKTFGIEESKDPIAAATELIGSMVSPSLASKAVILPLSMILKDFSTFNKANKLANASVGATEVAPGVVAYRGPVDDIMKAALSDAPAKLLESPNIKRTSSDVNWQGPTMRISVPTSSKAKLSEVLDHPELYKAMPELADVNIRNDFAGYKSGAYSSDSNTIYMGMHNTDEDFTSTLLHEVQHAIQDKTGMVRGGNPGMFIENQKALQTAITKARNMRDEMADQLSRSNTDGKMTRAELADSPLAEKKEFMQSIVDKLYKVDSNAYKGYTQLGGEAESRAVQSMFTNTKKSINPLDHYDISIDALTDPKSIGTKFDMTPEIQTIINFLNKYPTK